jgi:hypothetical protein
MGLLKKGGFFSISLLPSLPSLSSKVKEHNIRVHLTFRTTLKEDLMTFGTTISRVHMNLGLTIKTDHMNFGTVHMNLGLSIKRDHLNIETT